MSESTAPVNPTVWLHFILSCAVPTSAGICGEAIENEPCPTHGTEASAHA